MASNFLMLNDDKTEFLLVTAPLLQGKVSVSGINIGGNNIVTTSSARNLGVIFLFWSGDGKAGQQHLQVCYG